MAKATFRQRGRKINHKTRLSLKKGWEAIGIVDELEEGESRYEFDDPTNALLAAGVSTGARGVDQVESEEHHLKQVLAARSSTATPSQTRAPTPKASFILSSNGGGRVTLTPSPSPTPTPTPPPPATTAIIPTPASSGLVDPEVYSSLYPPNSFVDTFTNIRFSDTVEECMEGAIDYTMDEEDEEWLMRFNEEIEKGAAERSRKGEGAARGRQPRSTIREDEFELIMEALEKALEEQRETVTRVKPTFIPSFDSLKPVLLRQPSLILRPLPPAAEWIYPHWKQRRIARGGQRIIPQLDSNDANEGPYVCFRRREVKLARKTRHSDQKKVDRLIAHRNDLFIVRELMKMVLDRSKLRLEETRLDRAVFEKQVEVRELKRRLGEADGDEQLLVVPERKRRKMLLQKTPSTSSKSSSPSSGHPGLSPRPVVSLEERKAQKERSQAISTRLEDDAQQRRAADRGWEEATDTAFHSRGVSGGNRYWRTPKAVPGSSRYQGKDGEWRDMLGFDPAMVDGGGWRGPIFRLRRGRGGRVMMDRAGLHGREGARVYEREKGEEGSEAEEEEQQGWARRLERLKYDDDLPLHSLPTTKDSQIIDDYSPAYLARRIKLTTWDDLELGAPDSQYLEQAFQHLDQLASEPEKPPPEIVGRPRPPNAFLAVPMTPASAPPALGAAPAQARTPAEDALARVGLAVLESKRIAFHHAQLDKQKQSQALAQAQALGHLERFSEMSRSIASAPASAPPVSFPVQASGSAASLRFPLPSQPPNGAPIPSQTSPPQLPAAWMAANTQHAQSLSQAPHTASGSLLPPLGFGASVLYGRTSPSSSTAAPLPKGLLASLPPLSSPRQQLHGSHTSPVNTTPLLLPTPLPLGANNLPATSRLAAPPLQASLSSSESPSLSPATPVRRTSATPASAAAQVGAPSSPPFSAFPSPSSASVTAAGMARRAASEGARGSDAGGGGMRIIYPGAGTVGAGGGASGVTPDIEAFLNQLQLLRAQGATKASVGSPASG